MSGAGGRDPAATDGGALASLSVETRLLLAAAPLDPDPDRLEALLAEDVDWDRVRALLESERAALPFWRRVAPLAERMDPGVRSRLERTAAATELRLDLLHRRLVESLDALEEAGIDAVVLKGAALAHTLYPDRGERPMADLDLLVARERAGEARRSLAGAGWRADESRYPAHRYRRHHHLPPLRDTSGSGASLEIHTGLLLPGHPFGLDGSALLERARTVEAAGRTMRVPGPVDHLVHLCLHFGWADVLGSGAWRTFRDVDVLAGAPGFSWEAFLGRAREVGAGPYAWWTLRLRESLVGRPAPAAVAGALRPPLPPFLLRRLERHLVSGLFPTEDGCPSIGLERALWLLATRPRGERPPGIRPWDREEEFMDGRAADGPEAASPRVGARLRRHVGQWRRWGGYLSRVLAG